MTVITISSQCFCAFNSYSPQLKCMELLTLNHLFKEEVSTPVSGGERVLSLPIASEVGFLEIS